MTIHKVPFIEVDGQIHVTKNILKNVHNLVCQSELMQKVIEDAVKVAQTDATVLITGESGTGKELIANLIHKISPRRNNLLLSANCAAFTDTLLESELFGHEKGAFTGAVDSRVGLLEGANKGTLLLDEVAEMSPSLQAKILRAIQYGTFSKVGSYKNNVVDVRIIAATNKDLLEEVEKRNFREDLYYRLNVVQIYVPCLRHRTTDTEILANFFLDKFNNKNVKEKCFNSKVSKLLHAHSWPGNVRELENAVERAALMSDGVTIRPADFPTTVLLGHGIKRLNDHVYIGGTLSDAIEKFKLEFIKQSLISHNGSVQDTAKTLNIQRTYLSKLISNYGITRKRTYE
jgi:transcriptional regulator with PAS, ATPase and Fis domain